MDVHPPHAAIRSVKDFLLHLLAIAIGLLIALGLEASVEWRHHRQLVREAKENILQEIRPQESGPTTSRIERPAWRRETPSGSTCAGQ